MDIYLQRAKQLMREVPLIDGHNDFPYMVRGWHGGYKGPRDIDIQRMPIGQTDIDRVRRSGIGGQFWSAYVPCGKDDSVPSDFDVLKSTLQQIDLIHEMIDDNPQALGLATSTEDVWRHHRFGRVASLIGVEGLHQIVGSASVLRAYHRLGVQYITLCHDDHNQYADSATSKLPAANGGLSDDGVRLIKEMNRIGMIADLSHTDHATQRQALEVAEAPLIFSHSSCYSLTEHPRNVPNDVLDALKLNGGVIMICFLRELVAPTGDAAAVATLGHVVDHIEHAGKRIGFEHVGIGSDFDGMLQGPAGLDDVKDFAQLVAEMLRRDIAENDVKKVIGLNVMRVLDEVQQHAVAAKSQRKKRLTDEICSPWTEAQRQLLVSMGAQRRDRERAEELPN